MPWNQRAGGEVGLYMTFYSWVKSRAVWDIKLQVPWETTIGTEFPGTGVLVSYEGMLMTPEALENYTYGYLGAAFGFPYQMLVTGSYVVAGFPNRGERRYNEVEDINYVMLGYRNGFVK